MFLVLVGYIIITRKRQTSSVYNLSQDIIVSQKQKLITQFVGDKLLNGIFYMEKRKLKKDTQHVLSTEGWGGMRASDDWLQSMEQTLITMCAGSLLWILCMLYTTYGLQ